MPLCERQMHNLERLVYNIHLPHGTPMIDINKKLGRDIQYTDTGIWAHPGLEMQQMILERWLEKRGELGI